MAMMSTSVTMAAIIFVIFILLLFLLIFIYRSLRFFFSSNRRSSQIKADDIERPLLSGNLENISGATCEISGDSAESTIQVNENGSSRMSHGIACNERPRSVDFHANERDSLILDVPSDALEGQHVGQTLKRASELSWPVETVTYSAREVDGEHIVIDGGHRKVSALSLRSSLMLEVIGGPSCGLCCSRQSTDASMLPLTLGRVAPSNFLLKDPEVSGKHALIRWNSHKSKWELVDMGSLNGTMLNSHVVHHRDSESRCWSEPVELASGDVITLGSSSKILVNIAQHTERQIPSGIGVASDPMALRRGGKRLPMEDMCLWQWPLPGVQQFGLFGIFDGHGGAEAAKAASKMLPENIANILSNFEKREKVISSCDAADVLRQAFSWTESDMTHQYEGCTATVLLVWLDSSKEMFAQCANVGDSACFISVSGKQIAMSEDHRVTSLPERNRLMKTGKPLKDGEARICGLNIARMFGDKFLKEQDERFSSEPYVSQPVHITKTCTAFALLASDGLWDVISAKKAEQLILRRKETCSAHEDGSAEMIANYVLNEARAMRTKDNTTVIFVDFDVLRTDSCITT